MRAIPVIALIVVLKMRLRARVRQDGTTGCWIWQGYTTARGVAQFRIGLTSKIGARSTWQLYRGEDPAELFVLHRCDNPTCVNPEHLFLGTHRDNMDDMLRKGRQAQMSDVAYTTMTPELARLAVARHQAGEKTLAIAAELNVNRSTLTNILLGHSWSHATGVQRPAPTGVGKMVRAPSVRHVTVAVDADMLAWLQEAAAENREVGSVLGAFAFAHKSNPDGAAADQLPRPPVLPGGVPGPGSGQVGGALVGQRDGDQQAGREVVAADRVVVVSTPAVAGPRTGFESYLAAVTEAPSLLAFRGAGWEG